ncbi:hypothetical protein FNF28_06221 [Cafeteria roenbergensis]|uniref:Major facilitator superfamily (MFS) profile domain-containing protein n=1 Tax=Cafeteria roenbergensis TaxID=33653 RepID=A0A5A8D1D1_CAFRO|nr:hypothetical protein FNF28_06221 [Cafeteria roenbergensis]
MRLGPLGVAPWLGAVVVLQLVNVVSQLDRYVLGYIASVEPKACAVLCSNCDACDARPVCTPCSECRTANDAQRYSVAEATCLSAAEYGVLTGVAFSLFYAAASAVTGPVLDRIGARVKWLLAAAVLIWSAATAAQALASTFWLLAICRALVGLAESVTSPAAYSVIAAVVPASRRSIANAVFSVGVYWGGGLASACLLLDNRVGWRAVVAGIGALGVVATALAAACLPSASSHRAMASRALSLGQGQTGGGDETVARVCATPGFVLTVVAATARFLAGLSIAFFLAKFMAAQFPTRADDFSIGNAVIVAACGTTSALGGGAVGDALSRFGPMAQLWVPIVGGLVAAGAMAVTFLSPSFEASMGGLAVAYLFAEAWFGPTLAAVQTLVPLDHIGTATALFVAITTAGGSVAPAVLGAVWDSLDDKRDIRFALVAAVSGCYVIASAAFALVIARAKPVGSDAGSSAGR